MKATLKCDPKKLPEPPYPPTRSTRVPEKVDIPPEALAKRCREQTQSGVGWAPAKQNQEAYTPEQEQRMVDLYKQGMTYAAIGKIMGKSRNAMKQKLERMRKEQRFERECQIRSEYGGYTPAQDAVIREMRAQGKSYKAIGEQIGKSKEAVRKRYNMIGG